MISLSTRRAAKSFRQKHTNVSHLTFPFTMSFLWLVGQVKDLSVSVSLSELFQRIISTGCVCRRDNVILFCLFSHSIVGVSCNRLGQHSCLRCKVREAYCVPKFIIHVYLLISCTKHFHVKLHPPYRLTSQTLSTTNNPHLLTDETESNEILLLSFCF